jgi:hypothetical protein
VVVVAPLTALAAAIVAQIMVVVVFNAPDFEPH